MCDVRAVWMWMRTWMLSLLTSSVSEPRRAEIVTISSAVCLVSRSVYPLLCPACRSYYSARNHVHQARPRRGCSWRWRQVGNDGGAGEGYISFSHGTTYHIITGNAFCIASCHFASHSAAISCLLLALLLLLLLLPCVSLASQGFRRANELRVVWTILDGCE